MVDYSQLPQGVDVSHWNGSVDWNKLADAGVEFAYIKATQGLAEDVRFQANATNAQAAGILTLAYPFVTATDTQDCADKFKSVVGDMAAVLDCEVAGLEKAVPVWIEGLAGRLTLLYVGLYPPFTVPQAAWNLPRILPEYSSQPRIPMWNGNSVPDWKNEWLIWQRSEKGTFNGEVGNFDLDVLAIDIVRFRNWCVTGAFSTNQGPLITVSPSIPTIPTVMQLQYALYASGQYQGQIDGLWGPQSSAALSAYYKSQQ